MDVRRLPVYIIFDASGQMTGEPITAAQNQLLALFEVMRRHNQHDLIWVSVMTVSSIPIMVCPLSSLEKASEFISKKTLWKTGGVFALGHALGVITGRILAEVHRNRGQKEFSDYRPLLILFTNGYAGDYFEDRVMILRKDVGAKIIIYVVGKENDNKQQLEHLGLADVILYSNNSGADAWSQHIRVEECK